MPQPQQRTDIGMPPAEYEWDGPQGLDIDRGSASHDPHWPARRRDHGGPSTGRSSVPWFGGESGES
jgi:hypothetical protein